MDEWMSGSVNRMLGQGMLFRMGCFGWRRVAQGGERGRRRREGERERGREALGLRKEVQV